MTNVLPLRHAANRERRDTDVDAVSRRWQAPHNKYDDDDDDDDDDDNLDVLLTMTF